MVYAEERDREFGRPLSEYHERDFGGAERALRQEEWWRTYGPIIIGLIVAAGGLALIFLGPMLADLVTSWFAA